MTPDDDLSRIISDEIEILSYPDDFKTNTLYRHVAMQKKLYYIGGRCHFYIEKYGFFKPLTPLQEVMCISSFFSEEARMNISSSAVQEMAKRMSMNGSIILSPERMNPAKHLINTPNGAVNILTREVSEHKFEHLFTYCLNANYDPNASLDNAKYLSHYFATTLEGKPDKIKLLLEIIGFIVSNLDGVKAVVWTAGQ